MTNPPGDSFIVYIKETMSPEDIIALCAILLGVDVSTLKAWMARCAGGQNK